MATKMLREAISSAEDMWGSSTTEIGTGAWAELEALVKMARTIVEAQDNGGVPHHHVDKAWTLLREMTKETP